MSIDVCMCGGSRRSSRRRWKWKGLRPSGSGATPDSLAGLYAHANAVIVGSWFKRDGLWSNEPKASRARELVAAADEARG